LLAECNFKMENFVRMNAFHCYNTVRLFMEALFLNCLVEHCKMDVTLLVINKVQFIGFASHKHFSGNPQRTNQTTQHCNLPYQSSSGPIDSKRNINSGGKIEYRSGQIS
jgi:hypothetical protein